MRSYASWRSNYPWENTWNQEKESAHGQAYGTHKKCIIIISQNAEGEKFLAHTKLLQQNFLWLSL